MPSQPTPPAPNPVTHPWQSVRVLCRRGLRGYDAHGHPAWMVAPGTWFGVVEASVEATVLGERKIMYYLGLLPGQDTGRVRYRACTSYLYEADDLWELWRPGDIGIGAVCGGVGGGGEEIAGAALEAWWAEGVGNGSEVVA